MLGISYNVFKAIQLSARPTRKLAADVEHYTILSGYVTELYQWSFNIVIETVYLLCVGI